MKDNRIVSAKSMLLPVLLPVCIVCIAALTYVSIRQVNPDSYKQARAATYGPPLEMSFITTCVDATFKREKDLELSARESLAIEECSKKANEIVEDCAQGEAKRYRGCWGDAK